MSKNSSDEKEDIQDALSGINDGLSNILDECMVVGRYIWNMEMRILKSAHVMPYFVSHWWLFVALGFFLLAFVMPLGVAFVFTAIAAGQMGPKSKDEFKVPLRRDVLDHMGVEDNNPEKSDASREYRNKMGAFKDITLDWVVREHGPLLELPKDITASLSMYLIEASAEACKLIGIKDELHKSMHLALLEQMGFPPEFASGMIDAAMSNPFIDGETTPGGCGYKAWEQHGKDAAIRNVEKAYSNWIRAIGISDELDKMVS